MRHFLVGICRLLLRIFFRRIEVSGAENLPAKGPVLFVLNHPNGLIDPLFILGFANRPVSFLAKEPLFRMPVIGACLRALDALPVYRTKDQADPKQNAKTFENARGILSRGGSLAIFPEGTSHSDPQMKPMKTGAARIAIGAAATPECLPLRIVPVGLSYTAKQTFRSDALVCVGAPFDVPHLPLDEQGEPPKEPVRELTAAIASALGAVLVQADRVETLRAIDAARRIFSAEEPEGERDLERALELGQRIGKAEVTLRFADPTIVRDVTNRVLTYEANLRALGVASGQLRPPRLNLSFVLRRIGLSVLWLPISVLAICGIALNFLPYRFTALIARRVKKEEEDVVATAKVLSASLAYPVTWIGLGVLGFVLRGALLGAALLVAGPLLGYLAVRLRERLAETRASLRALYLWTSKRQAFVGLLEEQRALHDLMAKIADSLPL